MQTVQHQLRRKRNMEYIIEDTKTESGIRLVPMIDGKIGFLYLDKNEMPMVSLHWEKYFLHFTATDKHFTAIKLF